MSVAISVDADTESLARKLAEIKGKPLSAIVKEAIEASAAAAAGGHVDTHAQRPSRAELLASMIEITSEISRLPVLDARSAEEIVGYDDHGLPT